MTQGIKVGSLAPGYRYHDREGRERDLGELWADGPALVVWLRHCG